MPNPTSIPSSRTPLVDPKTGLMSSEWFRFFYAVYGVTLSDGNTTSLTDLQVQPTTVVPSWAPPGMVVLWSGTRANIPPGWSEYTALRGYFPRGALSTDTPGTSGGAASVTVTTSVNNSNITLDLTAGSTATPTVANQGHTHNATVSTLPPYINLLWIIKD